MPILSNLYSNGSHSYLVGLYLHHSYGTNDIELKKDLVKSPCRLPNEGTTGYVNWPEASSPPADYI